MSKVAERVQIVLVLVALACLLAGCAADDGRSDRTLRIGIYSDPLSLDPHFKNEVLTFDTLAHVYEGLTRIDPRGRVQPSLAERWENPDEVRWHFVLREGVTFHDGRKLTAIDVVASLDRALRHPQTNMSSYVVEIETVHALDARTLEIVTRRPYPILLNKLAFVAIVPADAPSEITSPVGTGPYRFLGHEPGVAVRFAAHDGWWGPPPTFRDVELTIVADPRERVDRLIDGTLDLAMEVDPEHGPLVEATEGARLATAPGLQIEYLGMRPTAPPFDDPRVREAVDLALDRQALIDAELGGFGAATRQMVGVHVFGHDPKLGPPVHDPERARELLAAAGYPDGIDVDLEARVGRPLDLVAAQLGAAGIRVTPRAAPWPEVYERLGSGKISFYRGGMLAVSADASDVFDSVAHTEDPGSGYGQNNSMGYSNPQLDRLVEESASALDMLERRAMLQEAMGLLVADRVYLGLFASEEVCGVRVGLDWQPRIDGFVFAWEVGLGDPGAKASGGAGAS